MRYRIITLALLIFVMGCSTATPTPEAVDTNQVATIVAATFSAIVSPTPAPTTTETPPPTRVATLAPTATSTPEVPSVLPRSLYYLSNQSSNGLTQIFRMDKDGATITQITFEDMDVIGFDVASDSGNLVFASADQLISTDPNGANRQVLIKYSELLDPSEPRWFPAGQGVTYFPNGQSVAYSINGDLYFYSLATGENNLVLVKVVVGHQNERYYPGEFSPDGTKLLVHISYMFSGRLGIYEPGSNNFIHYAQNKEPGNPPFQGGKINWVDSDTLFGSNNLFAGGSFPGLWQINANDMSSQVLIWSNSTSANIGIAAPKSDLKGNLIYLITYSGTDSPMYLVSSEADGITNQITLRPDTFWVNETLWTPDGAELLIISRPGIDDYSSQKLILVPIDSSKPTVELASGQISKLRWGP